MCGIAGVLTRRTDSAPFPVGQALLMMAACLQHRGRDSAGIAVFESPSDAPQTLHLQVALTGDMTLPEPKDVLALGAGRLTDLRLEHGGFSATLRPATKSTDLADSALVTQIEHGLPGSTVLALGESLRLHKAVGLAEELTTDVSQLVGTHGIAHLRLATESRIDPAHAQPFWGRPFPDIAVTHNGHITNYYKLRQRFEARGFSFASKNDSEIIGIYLGDLMSQGMSLRDALETARLELDGSFSFIVATARGLGVARDPFATKPLLFVETDDQVTLASEQQALHHLLGEEIRIQEIQPREVRVWERA